MKYYVDASVSRSGNGSREYPFRHIQEAANLAKAGDEVLVAVVPGPVGPVALEKVHRAVGPGDIPVQADGDI